MAGGDFWIRQLTEGLLLAAQGDTAGVRRVLRALDRDPRYAQRAMLHHAVGQRDSMYALFDRAIDARDPDALWILNAMPNRYTLRSEPRYQKLLARMGLPEERRR